MSEQTPISDVSDTAFWVAHYRAQESERGNALFNDPFAARLVGEKGRRISEAMAGIGKYVEWSVVSRTVLIDRFIGKLVSEGVDTVINLGAGLDARPYRMDLPASLEWVEADYPGIIAHKSRILAAETPRCRLTRVEVDLADGAARRSFLASVAPGSKKALVLTEGVIPYLSPEQVAELGSDLRSQGRFAFWVTEYFHPRTYRFLRHPGRTSKLKNAPFRFFPEDWFGFFRGIGWAPRETRFTGEIAVEFNRRLPMPRLAELLMPLLPRKVKEEAQRSTGFVVLERAPSGHGAFAS